MKWADVEDGIVAELRDHVLSNPDWLLRQPAYGVGCDYGVGILLDREEVERDVIRTKGRLPEVWFTPVVARISISALDDPPESSSFRRREWRCMAPQAWYNLAASFVQPPRGVRVDPHTHQWTVGFAFYEER